MSRPTQTLSPSLMQALLDLHAQLNSTAHGERSRMVQRFANGVGRQANTVYTWLKKYAGYQPARKVRVDCGVTKLATEALTFIASAKREAVRGNGKATMPTGVAMNIAANNGMSVNVSKSRINALMRKQRLDVASASHARNTIQLRSLYPNHVHQIDPSLCLVYYMGGKQRVIRDEEFYKNKLEKLAKVQLKVWRYVRYDHASGTVDVRYFEAAGESQQSLFEFLLYTWGKQPNRLSYGVPKILLWDKGSANTSHGIVNLLDALGVQHQTHAAGHAWAKGGVEQANNLIETQFESRLRFEPVNTVAALNAAAEAWVRDWNANLLQHIDARIMRASGEKLVRDDLWQSILRTPEALIEMPARQVCAWFLHGQSFTRVVNNLQISFRHPELKVKSTYDLKPWAEFLGQKDKVTVTPLLLKGGMVRVEIGVFGKAPLMVEVEPIRNFDSFGRALEAQTIGEGFSRAKETAAELAAKQLVQAAYGDGVSMDDADKLRAKQTKPFAYMNDGKGVVAHSHLGKAQVSARLLPAATEIKTTQMQSAKSMRIETAPLSLAEACKLIKGIQGEHYNPSTYAWLAARFADGKVPQDYAETLAHSPAHLATGTDDVAGLRLVK